MENIKQFFALEKNEYIKKKEEYKIYLQNGILLILLGIMYFFVSSYMYFNGTNTNMHEYITYLVALMAFYSIGTAIYGIVKYKRSTEPIVKGIKITNFANALTSIVLTQVVLLDTFSENYDGTVDVFISLYQSLIDKIYAKKEFKSFGYVTKCYKNYIREKVDVNWISEDNRCKMTLNTHNDVKIANIYYLDTREKFDIIFNSNETDGVAFDMIKIWTSEGR